MSLRMRLISLIALLVFYVALTVVLRAAEPCRNETICSQYGPWHPFYYWHNCDKPPCGQEPM